jgi:hypothetical protein
MLRDLSSGHLVQRRLREDAQFLGGCGDASGIAFDCSRFRAVTKIRGQIQQPEQPTDDKRQGWSESAVHVLYGKSQTA